MSFAISTYLTHAVQLPRDSSFDATVGASTQTITVTAAWYIALFYAGDPSGTQDSPWLVETVVGLCNTALGPGFVSRLRRDGRIEVTHLYDSWALAWGGTAAGALLGFARSIATTSAGVWVCADYHPPGVIASACRIDTGPLPTSRGKWLADPRAAGGRYASAIGGDGYTAARREVTFRYHPRDAASALALGSTATPVFPTLDQYFRTSGNVGTDFLVGDTTGFAQPWTILDSAMAGLPPTPWVGAFGNFQDFCTDTGVALSEPVYATREYARLCYLDATGMDGLRVTPSHPGSRRLRDVASLAFVFAGFGQDYAWSPASTY